MQRRELSFSNFSTEARIRSCINSFSASAQATRDTSLTRLLLLAKPRISTNSRSTVALLFLLQLASCSASVFALALQPSVGWFGSEHARTLPTRGPRLALYFCLSSVLRTLQSCCAGVGEMRGNAGRCQRRKVDGLVMHTSCSLACLFASCIIVTSYEPSSVPGSDENAQASSSRPQTSFPPPISRLRPYLWIRNSTP